MAILDEQGGGILKKKTTLNPAFQSQNLGWGSSAPLAAPAAPQANEQDYFQAATGAPIFKQTQGDIAADRTNFGNTRRAAIQGAVGVLGFVPEGFNDSYGDIDDATRALAEKNTSAGTSTFARLRDAHTKAVRDSMRQAASRGVLRSGEAGYQLNQRELENRQALSDTVSKFLTYLQTGVYGPYAEALAGLNSQEREALMRVYETIREQGLLNGPVERPPVDMPRMQADGMQAARSTARDVGSTIGSALAGFKSPGSAVPIFGDVIQPPAPKPSKTIAARIASGRM